MLLIGAVWCLQSGVASKLGLQASTDPFKPMVRGWSDQNSGLFVLLTISAGLGSAGFLLLRKADPSRGTPATLDTRSVKAQIWGTMMVTLLPKMICLIPLFTFTGVAMTMYSLALS